uniref:hypothetical protein n=1 Tax=unclassified Rhodococcus (in: high G+C Gram-positive bacteria) TaxID=192944 RepID=UPI0011407517|nr:MULTISPECIES: hypothetical protein [unclassified Rhodococcus (in: high G+C Gram-positive bacteria)]
MANTMGTVPQQQMYDCKAGFDVLTQIVTRTNAAGIPTSDRVEQTLTELRDLVDNQALAVAGLAEFRPDSPQNAELLDKLADGLADGTSTPSEVVTLLHRLAEGSDRPLRKLQNSVKFRFAKRADQALRQLGDTIALDLLGPWVRKLATELETPALVIVEHGPVLTEKDHHTVQAAFSDAERAVDDIKLAWKFAAALRRNGVLTGDDSIDQRHFQWSRIDKLHDVDAQHREPHWTAKSLLNGAGPRVATTADVKTKVLTTA